MESTIDPEALVPKRWTAEEYLRLAERGALEGARVELVEGVIIEMVPQGMPHIQVLTALNRVFTRLAPDHLAVLVQSPLALGDRSVPEPDLAIVPASELQAGQRAPGKALLVVEVSDSSLKVDRAKALIYAKAGIPEYWLVNLQAQTVEVHTQPSSQGLYRTVHTQTHEDRLTTPAVTGLELSVASLFAGVH